MRCGYSVSPRLQNLTGRVSATEEEERRPLQNNNPSKAAGPDRVSPRLLTLCVEQLAHIMSFSFLDFFLVWTCFLVLTQSLHVGKLHCIVQVPKKAAITAMNDLCPVALMSQL